MILKENDKVLVAFRRLFPNDDSRFFIGTVLAYEGGIIKIRGRSFVRDVGSGKMLENQERTKIVPLASGTVLAYELPEDTVMDSIHFSWEDARLLVRDGEGFVMDLTEFPHIGGPSASDVPYS